MKQAGHIVATVLKEMERLVKPGVTTMFLDQEAERIIRSYGATPSFKGYGGFPGSVCASVNEVLIHGIPGNRVLKDGDIISIDVGAYYNGYHSDSARTYAVGNISEEAQRLMDVTKKALEIAISTVRPDARIGDVSNAIQTYVESFGYSLPIDYTGHGVGKDLHEDPIVPNWGEKGLGPRLKVGMVIAIEPMVNQGSRRTRVLNDDWTVVTEDKKLSAHYEHTVVVTEDGCEILSKLKEEERN